MGGRDSNYPLGSGDEELARLEIQGRLLGPATRMIFAEAGIRPGMKVLDLGCGAGDVAFVAASLVGPDGSSSASTARRRRSGRLVYGLNNAAWPRCGSWRVTSTTRCQAGRSMRSSGGWS
jgi:hypothetical protein